MTNRKTKRQTALENVSALASIGIQAIEVQKARRAWIKAKRENGRLLKEWGSEVGDAYTSGDPDIDEAYQARKAAAKESLKQARKLRTMVDKYSENLAKVLA